jgi:hypothetical protein
MPDNQFNSLDYSDPMVCRVLNAEWHRYFREFL